MSPRLALAKPLTGSGHGSGAHKKKGDLLGRLFLIVEQANSLSYLLVRSASIGFDLETDVTILNCH